MRSLLLLSASASLLSLAASACSASTPAPAPTPAGPSVEAPATVDVYEGRASDITLTVGSKGGPPVVEGSADGAITVTASEPEAAGPDTFRVTLKVRAGYGITSGPLSVTVTDAAGAVETRAITLTAHHLGWKPRATWTQGPATREHGVFLLGKDGTKAHLIQGSGYSPQWVPIADSWTLDLTTQTWAPLALSGDLTEPVAGMRVAQAPGVSVGYLYGGYTGFGATEKTQEDIYRLDPGNASKMVTRLAKSGDVSSRSLHAFVYDPKGEQLIGFGGATSTPRQDILVDAFTVKVSGDSAVFATLATAGKKPEPRYGMFYALDADAQRLVVFSGGQIPTATDPVNAVNDVWALSLGTAPATWSQITPAGTAPPGRRNGCSMHDPVGRRLFVFGGTSDGRTTQPGLFVLSLEPGNESWTRLDLAGAPPIRSSGFGFALPDGSVACAFGNGDKAYADVNVIGYVD